MAAQMAMMSTMAAMTMVVVRFMEFSPEFTCEMSGRSKSPAP
jgi:hypothetical protein